MPVYTYEALDSAGGEVSGTVNAADDAGARSHLRELGYHPLEVRRATAGPVEAPLGGVGGESRRRGRRIRANDLTFFTRQLANLVRGGLPIMRTLDALIENTENARLHEILTAMRAEVSGGAGLHEAMEKYPRVFSVLYVSLVRAGEESGELAAVLLRLADFLEQDLERRNQILAALAYPALLLTVGTLIVFTLVTFLIPKFKVLFDEFERALPLATRIVLGLSSFLQHYWLPLLVGGALVILCHRRWVATDRGRLTWDGWRLRWPLVGKLYERAATARMSRTLATLLHGGVNILDALEIVEGVVDNSALAAAIREIRVGVREGESMAVRTRSSGRFPGLLAQMMLVGEETGDVEGALNTVADAFDVEVATKLKGLVALIEPVIILIMGGFVALVVFAMLMPIFQLNQGMM